MSKQSRDLWNEQRISKFKDCCVWIHVRLSVSSTVRRSLSGGASTGLGTKCSLLRHNLTKEKGGVSEAMALHWGWILGYRKADSISLKSKDPEHAVQALFGLSKVTVYPESCISSRSKRLTVGPHTARGNVQYPLIRDSTCYHSV